MSTIFTSLFFLSLLGLAIGLVRPSLIKLVSRKQVALIFGGATLFFFVGIAFFASGSLPSAPVSTDFAATTTTQAVSQHSSTTAPIVQRSQDVRPILTASTQDVIKVFASGKTTLGTTQYSSGTQGNAAFSDPNSPAVIFGAFRTSTCIQNDPSGGVMNAYRIASDALSPKTNTDALDAWSADMNDATSDLCLWAGDAVSWQIKEISTTQLKADEAKFNQDIAKANKDIGQL
jgi:hypothetical protein